jgi:hypothetical protein
MAPEQADGRLDLLDDRTDVYGLGAILYHLLTGAPPFSGADTPEVLDRVRHEAPPAMAREAPRALEAVCRKALAKRREDRYPSAQALAAEVRRWLADEPVSAYRDPLTVRLTRWARRRRTAVTTAAALLLTAMLALVIGLVVVKAEETRTAEAKQKTQEAIELVTKEQERTKEALAQVTAEQRKTKEALDEKTTALERSEKAEKSANQQRDDILGIVRFLIHNITFRMNRMNNYNGLADGMLGSVLDVLPDVLRDADRAPAINLDNIYAHIDLGDIFRRRGRIVESKVQYEMARDVSQQVWETNRGSAQAQHCLLVSCLNLGLVSEQTYDFKAALGWYAQALDSAKNLPTPDIIREDITRLEDRSRLCHVTEQAVTDPATALKQPENLRRSALAAAMFALAKKENQPAKAVIAANLLADNAKGPGDLYDAACGYALCARLTYEPETQERYAARAVELLRQAAAKGYKDAAHMKADTNLEALRRRDDFKKLLADLEAAAKPKDKKEP